MLVVACVLLAPAAARAACGDANGDGRVTVSDGVQVLRAAAGLSSTCDARCDVDGSGAVTVSDGVNVLRKAAGLAIDERCPSDDPVATLIGHTVGVFGPLTKVGALGGGAAAAASPCENPGGSVQQTSAGFTFDDCDIGGVALTGFLGTSNGTLDFQNLTVTRLGDVVGLVGQLSVGATGGNSEVSGVLNGESQQLGSYVVTFQQAVTDAQGDAIDGTLDFDTSGSDIPRVVHVTVTLTNGTKYPVVVRYDDDTVADFTYDTTRGELTPVAGPTPTPTATPLPTTRVRLSNIDDRITAILNGTQVLQAASTGPGATQDTGFVTVNGLQCGDNVFEFRVENTVPGSGYTFHVQLQVDGATVVDRTCGQVGVQGCANNDQTQGEVVRDVTFFCLPCAPCTQGAGTCANPLTIPPSGRVQIHGRIAGASNGAGPCGGANGPESVFRFAPSVSGCYEFTSCGTTFDSRLSIGDDFCGGSGPFGESCIDGNQTCSDSSVHEYTFAPFNGGQPITILLDSQSKQGGSYTLDVRPSGACIF